MNNQLPIITTDDAAQIWAACRKLTGGKQPTPDQADRYFRALAKDMTLPMLTIDIYSAVYLSIILALRSTGKTTPRQLPPYALVQYAHAKLCQLANR